VPWACSRWPALIAGSAMCPTYSTAGPVLLPSHLVSEFSVITLIALPGALRLRIADGRQDREQQDHRMAANVRSQVLRAVCYLSSEVHWAATSRAHVARAALSTDYWFGS